jgi:MFS family permease
LPLVAASRGMCVTGKAMSAKLFAPKALQVAAAVIGNALEWYDFIVFGFFAVIIARLFFPAESQYASLLLTTATFGVGFFMRPVGGILIGIYADRRGRKASLLLIIGLMTLAIAMIGFAPTYAAIGIAAPLLVVLARLLQGFSAGGEFASSTAFLIESAPAHRRGYYGSWQMVAQGLAVLTGALLGALITRIFTPEALDSWAWRIPFLFGLVIGPLGLYIRRRLDETEDFLAITRSTGKQQALGAALAAHVRQVLATLGVVVSGTISFYVILLYMPTFARIQLHLPLDQAFSAQAISLACMIVLIPFRRVIRSYWAQADYDQRSLIVFCFDLSAVFLDVCQSIFCQSLDCSGHIVLPAGRNVWSHIDGTGRTISGSRAYDRTGNRLQPGCHVIRRFRAVFCDLVDPGNRLADSTSILCDVRRSSRDIGIAVTEGTCPRRRFGRHGS